MGIARCCGLATPANVSPILANARAAKWWREDWVEEVVGAVVADRYGEQAQ